MIADIVTKEFNMQSVKSMKQKLFYRIRWKLSNAALRVAMWIYPDNPDLPEFAFQVLKDQLIYGHHAIRIDPGDIFLLKKK